MRVDRVGRAATSVVAYGSVGGECGEGYCGVGGGGEGVNIERNNMNIIYLYII